MCGERAFLSEHGSQPLVLENQSHKDRPCRVVGGIGLEESFIRALSSAATERHLKAYDGHTSQRKFVYI